jgi:hypothetical protein
MTSGGGGGGVTGGRWGLERGSDIIDRGGQFNLVDIAKSERGNFNILDSEPLTHFLLANSTTNTQLFCPGLFCQGCRMQWAYQPNTNRPYGLPEYAGPLGFFSSPLIFTKITHRVITIDHMTSVQGPYAVIYRIPHDTYKVRLNQHNEVDLSLLPWYRSAREYLVRIFYATSLATFKNILYAIGFSDDILEEGYTGNIEAIS